MRISNLMAGLATAPKTAAVAAPPAPAAPAAGTKTASENTMAQALSTALDAATGVKVAAAATPALSAPESDLNKIASDILNAEKEASLAEIKMLGTAFADAAVARFSEYQKVAAEMNRGQPGQPMLKLSAQTGDAEFDKFANENEQLVATAVSQGYAPNRVGINKFAQDQFVQGYNDTVNDIYKTAQDEFLKGASVAHELIKANRAAQAQR